MLKNHTPIIWLPFAGGGALAASLLPPVLFLIGIAVPLGLLPPAAITYDRLYPFCAHPLTKLVLLGVLMNLLFHAAHRFRLLLQDLGMRGRFSQKIAMLSCYGTATLGTLALCGILILL